VELLLARAFWWRCNFRTLICWIRHLAVSRQGRPVHLPSHKTPGRTRTKRGIRFCEGTVFRTSQFCLSPPAIGLEGYGDSRAVRWLESRCYRVQAFRLSSAPPANSSYQPRQRIEGVEDLGVRPMAIAKRMSTGFAQSGGPSRPQQAGRMALVRRGTPAQARTLDGRYIRAQLPSPHAALPWLSWVTSPAQWRLL